MINIFLFLAFMFAATFIFGRLIEKLKVPWIFGALLLGFLLSVKNPFAQIVSSDAFGFLADLGLYLLLFVIGFEIDLKAIFKEGKFIIKSTLFIILFEALFGSILIHYFFGLSWLISAIVALSFATVGEAILIPILDEFKLLKTSLGRAIIGVGTLDDAFEIFTLVLAVLVIGAGSNHFSVFHVVSSLLILLALTFTFQLFGKETKTFKFFNVETLFFFSLIILFFFIGVGEYAEAASLGALFAGISLKTYLPEKRYKSIAGIVKAICYGFFAPIFFLDVGMNMNMSYLLTAPGIILVVVLVTFVAKLVASYIAAHKHFGFNDSMLLGVGLSVRFSTSMVIVKILLDSGVITNELFSIIIASSAIFTFVIPILFSHLLVKWHLSKQ
ncbi:MAG: cation:proton antiporter [Nanoarchaeota archaeon]|nr:cation:proton antiporter [Nanoarchaeota archaeon]